MLAIAFREQKKAREASRFFELAIRQFMTVKRGR